MKDLFVVTHAQSVHHIEKKVGGWFDTGLTEQGQQDALFVAAALLSAIGDKEVEIYSPDLKRASQTVDIIANHFERPVTTTKSLREISYGVAEGRPQEWLGARYKPAPDDDRLDHHGNIEGAESRRDVANRVIRF